MANSAGPAVLKTADFPRVSPDNLVVAVAEKRRVKIDEVNTVRAYCLENFEIVAEDKAVYRHESIRILLSAAAAVKAARVFSLLPEGDCVRAFGYFHFCHPAHMPHT
jgi:hypothetical protein